MLGHLRGSGPVSDHFKTGRFYNETEREIEASPGVIKPDLNMWGWVLGPMDTGQVKETEHKTPNLCHFPFILRQAIVPSEPKKKPP